MTTEIELKAGTVIAERYRLEHLLGEGGMGSVWAATHLLTRNPVALKFLKPEAAQSGAAVQRFMREARAASAVNHPNVIRIHDIFLLASGSPVMVMDFLSGESLGQRLEREGKISLERLASIMLPVVSAVGSAHAAGIVHRDLKPDNIFLAQMPDGSTAPKVLDFGIAKLNRDTPDAQQSANLTRTGALLGTPYYMSPEQVFGEKTIDARADVWAVGVILFEALTGVRPVDGENLGQLFKVIATGTTKSIDQVAPDLPLPVRELIATMLVADRDGRCASLQPAFNVFKRYTDIAAQSFAGAARLGDSGGPGSASRSDDGIGAMARTPSSTDPNAEPRPTTASSFASTGASDTIVTPVRRGPVVPIAVGALAVGAIAVTLWFANARSPAGAAAESAQAEPASAPAETSTHPASEIQAGPVAGSAAILEDAAAPAAAGTAARARPSPAPARDAAVAAPPAASAAAPAPKPESPGGIATAAPF